ncbi:unnamed protein product [Lactuca virosa]|uniref:Uncharacterized protein n=1 Tax=Lactuca virosa TaxID=75947 RepID=A0AAU9PW98_9ASTR|nr:unnamed protein product [Lactuca virosa]
MNVYIDHENELVLDWDDMEVVEDDEGHYSEQDPDDDNDSQLSDDIPYEHEADDYIPSLDKTIGDEFLHRVSGICKDTHDEVETNNGDEKPVYPIHNENQKWDKMVPVLGTVEPVQVDQVQVEEPVQVDQVQVEEPLQADQVQVEPVQVDPVQVDDPAQLVDDVQVDDPAPHVDVQVDDPAKPVTTGKRIQKYSEIITKIGLKKKGSTDHHPMVLE